MADAPQPVSRQAALERRARYVTDEARADGGFMEQIRAYEADQAHGILPVPPREIQRQEREGHGRVR